MTNHKPKRSRTLTIILLLPFGEGDHDVLRRHPLQYVRNRLARQVVQRRQEKEVGRLHPNEQEKQFPQNKVSQQPSDFSANWEATNIPESY